MRLAFLVVALCTNAVLAQIPFLGWCPQYSPMKDFDMDRFLGKWHEAERYFTVAELGTRCVATDYERKPDGKIWVSNQITNAFTGVKRIIDGQLQMTGQPGEGKMLVRYTSLPVPLDTAYSVLDTDYDSFAVVYNCNGIGPVHTQSAWVLTRERNAPSAVMQKAYGVLDNYKISRTFFIKTNQQDCAILPPPEEVYDNDDPDAVRQAVKPEDTLKEPTKTKGKEPTKGKFPQKPTKLDYQQDKPQDMLQDDKSQETPHERPQSEQKPIASHHGGVEGKPLEHDKPQILVQDKPYEDLQVPAHGKPEDFLHDKQHGALRKPIELMHDKQQEGLKDALPLPVPTHDMLPPKFEEKPEDIKAQMQPEMKKPASIPELIFAAADKTPESP